MKKLVLLLFMLLPCISFANDIDDIKSITNDMISHYQKDIFRSNKSKSDKIEQFNTEFKELLDMNSIIPVVLGSEYKKATKKQIEDFSKEFTDFNLNTFANYFDDYAKREFKYLSASPAKNKNQYFVKMQIINPDNKDDLINVQWRYKKHGDTYKIIDAVISDVSMVLNYKTEYADIIKKSKMDGKNGVDVLIQKLSLKNKELKTK